MRVIKKIGYHKLEVEFSIWTGHAIIELDGVEILSDWFFDTHEEVIDVYGRIFKVHFSGMFIAHIEIIEVEV